MRDFPTLARRDLLRGAAALAGGSALGLLPSFAEAALGTKRPTLGFWNGSRFVAVDRLPSSEPTLDRARLTVSSVHDSVARSLEAHAPCSGAGRYPFTLWVAPPHGLERSRSTVATERDGSLFLTAFDGAEVRHEIRIAAGALRAGTFVLVADPASLSRLKKDAETDRIEGDAAHIRIDVASL